MKSKRTLQTLAALSALAFPSTVLAQVGGPLDPPPGVPAPSMKSLDQIEPRIPLIDGAPGVFISAPSGTITIREPGSYYLTENLTITEGDGVNINADGVTLDLRGFTITSSAASSTGAGILINASHASVHNGHIISGITFDSGASGDQFTGGGFFNGVIAPTGSRTNIRIRNLSVSGCDNVGIFCNSFDSTLVESCTVQTVGDIGIQAGVIRDCNVSECGGMGIRAATVMNCRAESTGSDGIFADTVNNSFGFTNGNSEGDNGIDANRSVSNSYGQSDNTAGGRGIISAGTVSNSHGRSAGSDGILSSGPVSNSFGFTNGNSSDDHGIQATRSVNSSYGQSNNTAGGIGIVSFSTVSNSYGRSAGNVGIFSSATVSNSYGYTNGNTTNDHGIQANRSVSNSYGESDNLAGGDGINTTLVSYSFGLSDGTSAEADGIEALTAIGCFVDGGQRITNSFLMPDAP